MKNRNFFHTEIEISTKKLQLTLQLDFWTLYEKVAGWRRQERTSLIFNPYKIVSERDYGFILIIIC